MLWHEGMLWHQGHLHCIVHNIIADVAKHREGLGLGSAITMS